MWQLVIVVSFVLAIVIGKIQLGQLERSHEDEPSPQLRAFQSLYFLVYILANASDWLQGPYVYALYHDYGHDADTIAILYIAGFISSMLFGTFMGSLADIYGRKRMTLAFGVIYSLSCLTKLSPNFWILLLGRLTGGIATSLLFCVFESWMVHEHHRLGFDQNSLNSIFAKSGMLNSMAAIGSGLLAAFVASLFGYVAPFMLSLVVLVALTLIVWVKWPENYGNSRMNVSQNLRNAFTAINGNFAILQLGVVQSLFEGSMYVFVFLWTPILAVGEPEFYESKTKLHGLVFSSYMLAIMLGSALFPKLTAKRSPAELMKTVMACAALTFVVPVVTSNPYLCFLSFVAFEFCCGLYFPAAGSLRSFVIPEDSRATIMSMYRMGLNMLVIFALKGTSFLPAQFTFLFCSSWLAIAAVMMHYFPERPNSDHLLVM